MGYTIIMAAGKSMKLANPMRNIKMEKLCVNICVGEAGDRVLKAHKILEGICEQVPCYGQAKITIRSFSIRRNEKISVYATLRGEQAERILERALKVKEFELRDNNFSEQGTFGFGIKEHIDLGVKYDPALGITGIDFTVVLKRPGTRVGRRKHCRSRIGINQKVNKEDAIQWFKSSYDGMVFA